MKVYVASPLGFSDVGGPYRRRIRNALTKAGHVVLDPWDLPPELARSLKDALRLPLSGEQQERLADLNIELGQRNARLIDECDALFAVLDGADVDSGTASEIGYAAGLKKRIVGLRTDFRLAGDNIGSRVNLQVEFFIHMSEGGLEKGLAQAVARLTAAGSRVL